MSFIRVFTLLSADSAFSSAIGMYNGTIKVYPNSSPQGVGKPYCVIKVIDVNPTKTKTDSKKDFKRLQFDFYADNYGTVEELHNLSRNVLDGFRGVVEGAKVEIDFSNENDGFEGDGESDRKSIDYFIRQHR